MNIFGRLFASFAILAFAGVAMWTSGRIGGAVERIGGALFAGSISGGALTALAWVWLS